jgi:hypothetical protein
MNNIRATLVKDELLDDFLSQQFGKFQVASELKIYSAFKSIVSEQSTFDWNYYTLSNDGFYMAPDSEKRFDVKCVRSPENVIRISADAAGIVATLIGLADLYEQVFKGDDRYLEKFFKLRAFADLHYEARLINQVFG